MLLNLKPIEICKPEEAMWRPWWTCYCCRDSGLIMPIRQYISPEWDKRQHKEFVCQASKCEAGMRLTTSSDPRIVSSHDTRATREICDGIARAEKKMWDKQLHDWWENPSEFNANREKVAQEISKISEQHEFGKPLNEEDLVNVALVAQKTREYTQFRKQPDLSEQITSGYRYDVGDGLDF